MNYLYAMTQLIHIGMATLPSRISYAAKAIESIIKQNYKNWELDVVLNGHSHKPKLFPNDSRIHYIISDNSEGDAAKFSPYKTSDHSLIATIDDDLNYPPDYLEKLYKWFEACNEKCAIGVYGYILKWEMSDFLNSITPFKLFKGLKGAWRVEFLGTGTTLFHRSMLDGYDFKKFRNRSDVGIGIHLAKKGIHRVVIPRPDKWITPLVRGTAIDKKTYNRTHADIQSFRSLFNKAPKSWIPAAPLFQTKKVLGVTSK